MKPVEDIITVLDTGLWEWKTKGFHDLAVKLKPGEYEITLKKIEPEPETKQAREGWMVQEPNCLKWYWEVDAEKRKKSIQPGDSWSSVLAWHEWISKRVAREGYEVKGPQSGAWFSEVYVSERPTDRICFHGWETWESRPIQEPEPESSEPPPVAGPGLREAARNLTDLLSEPEWATKEQMRLVSALEAALTRADEDARLVEAVVKAGEYVRKCIDVEIPIGKDTLAAQNFRTALDALKAAREGGKT